jgi:hypothetical protein
MGRRIRRKRCGWYALRRYSIMDDVTKIVVGAVSGAIITFVIQKFLNRDQDSLKSFGDLLGERFNNFQIQLTQIVKTFDEFKSEKRDYAKNLDAFRGVVEKNNIDIEGMRSKNMQLAEAIATVDLTLTEKIKHNKEMFDLYKQTIESYNKTIEGLLKERK